MEEYRVIRSARKTLSLEITEDLTVLVRAPYQVSQSRIEAFVAGQQDWITAHRERCRQWQEQHPEPTEEERLDCIARAKEMRFLPLQLPNRFRASVMVSPVGISPIRRP